MPPSSKAFVNPIPTKSSGCPPAQTNVFDGRHVHSLCPQSLTGLPRQPASPPVFTFPPPPLRLGNLVISPPIILAPMAGVTNYTFRNLCRPYGAALYISEMVLASSVLSNRAEGRVSFGPQEPVRSVQLYSTDAGEAAAAADLLIHRDAVEHIDLNFGCPAPKVLRKGGGAALAANLDKLRAITTRVVEVGGKCGVPVTAKMRAGLSEGELTYETEGRVLEECGVAAISMHARTAAEMYARGAGRRGWGRIRRLVDIVDVPVIGNGDVFTAKDAVEMVRETGSSGVMIGRGCLGRPWLFRDLREGFEGGTVRVSVPEFEEVRRVMMAHVEEGTRWGEGHGRGLIAMRKWFGWYWKGYTGLPEGWVARMCQANSLEELKRVVAEFGGEGVGFEMAEITGERGKVGGGKGTER
eukprot:GFKZ01010528.1.p1 GENE.GFKZ01010528.1~~GFKZ01010528.1.p1  ORF type:complete len:411 (+),score=52.97 GFKZ01010528.1:46-1278(+)